MPRSRFLSQNQIRIAEGLRPVGVMASLVAMSAIGRAHDPQFRFHGSVPPAPGCRTPLLNTATASQPDENGEVTIRLYDPIDSWGGDWGVSAIEFAECLDSIPNAQTIALHINSPGGEVFEAIAILNLLRQHPARVVAYVDGLAASAASFIATGADELIMGENSQLMIHDAWGICIGAAEDMNATAALLDRLSNNVAAVYAAKAGTPTVEWRAAMIAESWYTADEAVAAGLADSVASSDDSAPAALNRFDLSRFKHQTRATAPAPLFPAARAGTDDEGPAGSKARAQRMRHNANRLALAAARHGIDHDTARSAPIKNDANSDRAMLLQALGQMAAIDNIVDQAQVTLSEYLDVPNPDSDDDPEGDDPAED